MVISFIIVLNLIMLYLFFNAKKHLHLYEILVYWMVLSFLRQDFNAIVDVNLELVQVSQKLSDYWSIFFNRMILFPLPQVWFLSMYAGAPTLARKGLLFLGSAVFLTLLDRMMEPLGLIHFIHFAIWQTALFWASSMITGILLMKWFRKFLYAEVPR